MRTYKRKAENGHSPTTVVIEAAKHVIDGKVTSIRATAKKFGIYYSTLSRYINKVEKAVDIGNATTYAWLQKVASSFYF